MKTWMKTMLGLVVVVVLVGLALATPTSGIYWKTLSGNRYFPGQVYIDGDTTFGTSNVTLPSAGMVKLPTATAATLTSPTVTVSVAGVYRVSLTSDANLTTVVPTGGVVGQVVVLESGAGSNTIQLDDGTSTVLGANVVLTEGQGDVLTLVCTHADGDVWKAVSAHNN
ncbi:MAG TPA: hypothetical protein VMZ50_00280 [Phycisphaerae bacterium]|nr:hypothetical protein [Phycisphaerae bacterium]